MFLFREMVFDLIVVLSVIAVFCFIEWVISRVEMGKFREDRPDLFDKVEEN
jgi:hypothetical protein